MSINIEKLENVNYRGSRIIARCPACEEQGNDNKGEHLSIDDQERFSCVRYPGATGADHRKRIYALTGTKDVDNTLFSSQQKTVIKVRTVSRNTGNVIKRDVLGHLGRVNQTLKKHNENDIKERIYNKDFEKGVPNVPTTETEPKTCDVITETEVPATVEKLCKCGRRATTYDFGDIENGKIDWRFYCNSCNPHAIDCSECSNRAIPYVDPSGKTIFDKCNVHGARLKVTHAEIDAWSREKERNRNSTKESGDLSKRHF